MAKKPPPFPNALRMLVKSSGYTFKELSRESGIAPRTLFDWAAGNRIIHKPEREKLAYFIGCNPEDLSPRVPGVFLVESAHEQVNVTQQEAGNMNRKRRILIQTLGTATTTLFASPQDVLQPEPWKRLLTALTNPTNMDKGTLEHFARLIDTCWILSSGDGLATVGQLLPTFLPQLASFAEYTSEHQATAAHLASQGYQLMYVLSSHREDFNTALTACKQAQHYGVLAHDPNLQTLALIRQGVTFLNKKRPHQTLEAYQKALPLVDGVSPLLKTRLYASLAEVHGKLQQEQEALMSIGLAHESFPGNASNDPASRFVHFDKSSIYLHEGLALLDLQKPLHATKALEHIDGLHPKLPISERGRIDVLNQQALAAGMQHDLELFSAYLENAVVSARKLGSDLRVSEAWDVYAKTLPQWKYEPKMHALGKLFV